MTLTSVQKKWLLFFVCTLVPAYWFANWRHDATLTSLEDKLKREEALHLSTEKLIKNCALNVEKDQDPFDANRQICEQGNKTHQRTAQQIEALNQEKVTNDSRWYQNFGIFAGLLNIVGFLAFRSTRILQE